MASHGFVKFRAAQHANANVVPPGTLITNRASVRLGEKAALLTPTTHHRVGKNFVTSSVFDLAGTAQVSLRVSPNPASLGATLQLDVTPLRAGRFDLYDQGRRVLSRSFSGDQIELGGAPLPGGLYFFRVFERGQPLGVGSIVLEYGAHERKQHSPMPLIAA